MDWSAEIEITILTSPASSLPRSTTCWWSSNSASSATTSAASPSRCAREGDAVTNAREAPERALAPPQAGAPEGRQAPARVGAARRGLGLGGGPTTLATA